MKKSTKPPVDRFTLQTRYNLAMIIVTAVILLGLFLYTYDVAQTGINRAVEGRAKSELRSQCIDLESRLNMIEALVSNHARVVSDDLDDPDELFNHNRRFVEENPDIEGCFMAFIPNYFPKQGRWFECYAVRRDSGRIETRQMGSAQHDYTKSEFYTTPMSTGKPVWCEPYHDKDGAHMMLTTYSIPIKDDDDRIVAVLAVDISLDWLSTYLNSDLRYKSSYLMMLSRQGRLLAYPDTNLLADKTVHELNNKKRDPKVNEMNRRMMAGESGMVKVKAENGESTLVIFKPVSNDTGWSMAIVCREKEVFGNLYRTGNILMGLMLVALLALALMLWYATRSVNKLQAANDEKRRIDGELAIAANIQKGMLPSKLNRHHDNIQVHASLIPAKEVGGDLFDYYIRNEKLFFCVGDVSGKGVPASLLMAVTRSLFRSLSMHESNPTRIITTMNQTMVETSDSNMFVTLFAGVIDLPTGEMRFCNAGHTPPVFIHDGKANLLELNANLPLGVFADFTYKGQQLTLTGNDAIVIYTDGVTEAFNAQHEQFGEQRILDALQPIESHDPLPTPEQQIEHLILEVKQFSGDSIQSDDISILALRYVRPLDDVILQDKIVLPADIQQVGRLNDWIDSVTSRLGADDETAMNLRLAVEEAVVNVMNYAYKNEKNPDGTPVQGEVEVQAIADRLEVVFSVIDSGSPFDPSAIPDVDPTLPVEERPIGGLGIFMMRQLTDSINYKRLDEHNVTRLRKKYSN